MEMFKDMLQMQEIMERTVKTLGVPYADPFNEEAIIISVDDPKQEGRVKVQFKKDSIDSDWFFVNGSGSGQLSSQYIGARCTVIKIAGNSAAGIVTAIYSNDKNLGSIGNPLQFPIVSDQLASQSPGDGKDPGLKCNEGNRGRSYIISNEFGQDLVICLRRNSPQRDGADQASWAWKSLTHSEWIEKGLDPGAASDLTVSDKYKSNPGIPKCTKDLAGELHEFSEDRAYRSMMIVCRRDENGNYGWTPIGSTPTFFRTTLPNCTENLHGMNALVDTGRESEFVVCSRYAGKMLWTKQGKREPLQFFDKEIPVSKAKWIQGITPIDALNSTPKPGKLVEDTDKKVVITTAMQAISPTGTDPFLRSLLEAANALPGTFDASQTWSDVAKALIINKGSLPVESIITQLSESFEKGGDLSSGTSDVLSKLGGIADIIVTGVKSDRVQESLEVIGKRALGEALEMYSPAASSVFYGYMVGGALGAFDTAVASGLDILPDETREILSPIFSIGQRALRKQPIGYSTIIDAALNGGLIKSVQSILSGKLDLSDVSLDRLLTSSSDGSLGPIAQVFTDFSNLDSISKLAEGSVIPKLATTALSLIGQGKGFADFLGPGGIGTALAAEFTGNNPIVGLLGGLFGKSNAGPGCPCDPSCRKTGHGEDADGVNLLEKCGSVVANNVSSYTPTDNPLENNVNPIAIAKGLLPTGLGESLKAETLLDLTSMLATVPKQKDLAKTVFDARYADQPEFMAELAYSFEAVQTAFKQTDNNITKVESIDRKLIDASYKTLTTLLETGGGSKKGLGIINQLIKDVKDNSEAIRDLYKFAKSLDNKKKGPKAPVFPTSAIVRSIRNIKQLSLLNSLSKKEANKILNRGIRRADREWRTLNPSLDKLNLSNVILGEFSPDIPVYFEDEDMETFFNEDNVLNYSLSSRVNGTLPQQEDIGLRLSPEVSEDEDIDTVFREVERANEGNPDC